MQLSPGMAVLLSKDLLNWEIVGQVVDGLTRIIWRAGNTVTQRSARAASGGHRKNRQGHMADGQIAGLTHFSTTRCRLLDVNQVNGTRHLTYSYNGRVSPGTRGLWGIHQSASYFWQPATYSIFFCETQFVATFSTLL